MALDRRNDHPTTLHSAGNTRSQGQEVKGGEATRPQVIVHLYTHVCEHVYPRVDIIFIHTSILRYRPQLMHRMWLLIDSLYYSAIVTVVVTRFTLYAFEAQVGL